jgi:hypothetical protein
MIADDTHSSLAGIFGAYPASYEEMEIHLVKWNSITLCQVSPAVSNVEGKLGRLGESGKD